ncbi:response regulator [Pseudomonas sp. G34]|uniref:response regulator n=1 Tax=Pseudomonas sp. G34 TaxID=3059083 RepID=UPI0028099F45|nr:response regulator [Pseudomonas sp. G34]MDQ7987302.1 response regulator [Pseudomonas sp. G34]
MNNSILLVEDQALDLELTLIALRRAGMDGNLTVVRDGQEALDYLKCHSRFADREPGNPSLVIMDLATPKLSGLELLEAIRGCELLHDIPVVVLTNSRDPAAKQKAHDLQVSSYVVKPLALEDFVAAVSELGVLQAASRYRARRQPTAG